MLVSRGGREGRLRGVGMCVCCPASTAPLIQSDTLRPAEVACWRHTSAVAWSIRTLTVVLLGTLATVPPVWFWGGGLKGQRPSTAPYVVAQQRNTGRLA